ncbi:MAG: hypothetical protein E6H40_15110 [Betaproteobacteria bacterium]|nr:MAG: hypothetical protein E6H40_15110 [Betaproteobacteria bacterium]
MANRTLREVGKWILIVGLNLTVVNIATSIEPIDGPTPKRAMPAQSETKPLPTGIIEGSGDVSFPANITVENRWHGIINGKDIAVFAGGQIARDPGVYGIAIIEKRSGSPDHRSVRSVQSTNPITVGPLRIISAEGPVLTLQSRQGNKYLLDVEWGQFTPVDMRFLCARDYPGFISEGRSGLTFPYHDSERFGFCLDETTHPLKNLDTSDCRSVFKSVHVQIVGSGFGEQKSQLRPRIRIDEPRANHALKPGDPLAIQWQVTKKPNHPEDWEISVGLVNCGAGNRGLYSGAFSNDPGKLEWIPSAAEVTHPMETSWKIRVCLYDRKLGNDELRAMAMNCKAAATDNWLVCAYGSGSVRVVPK